MTEVIETKHLLALLLMLFCGAIGLFSTLISQRMRDVALFVFLIGVVWVEKINITLLGTFWYRGTSRGIEIAAVDILPICLLIATLLLPRYERSRFYLPAGIGWMILYFLYCCASVWHAEPHMQGVWELVKTFRGLLVFLGVAIFIRTRREVGVVVFALCCTACLESANALEQRLFKGAFRAPGTFDHENTLSTYLCTIAPVLLAAAMSDFPKWLRRFAGFSWVCAAGGELLTLSRLGIPVFTLVSLCTALACTSWRITKQKVAVVALSCMAIGTFLFFSWDGLVARYAQSNIKAEFTDENAFETRGVYYRIARMMMEDHPYGVGLNNWSYAVSKVYGPALGYRYHDYDEITWIPTKEEARETLLPPAADSLPALTVGELGVAGAVIFLLVWLRWFQMGAVFLGNRLNEDPMHRVAIGCLFGALGIFGQSATEWTYRQTPIMFTFHVLMAMLAAMYYARKKVKAAAKQRVAAAEEENDVEIIPVPVARVAK